MTTQSSIGGKRSGYSPRQFSRAERRSSARAEAKRHGRHYRTDREIFERLRREYDCWDVELGRPDNDYEASLLQRNDGSETYLVVFYKETGVWVCKSDPHEDVKEIGTPTFPSGEDARQHVHGVLVESLLEAGRKSYPTRRQAALHDAIPYPDIKDEDGVAVPGPCDHVLALRAFYLDHHCGDAA